MDPAPNPAIFRRLPSSCQQKSFSAYYRTGTVLKVHLHNFSKIKSHKKSRNEGFSYYFC
jgi:hypothetical protein